MLFCFAVVIAALVVPAAARADICPVTAVSVAPLPVGSDLRAPAARYVITLSSATPGTVTAQIVAVASDRIWSITSGSQPTHEVRSTYNRRFDSQPLVLRFPTAVRLRGVWVRDVDVDGRTKRCPVANVDTVEMTAQSRKPIELPKPGVRELAMADEGDAKVPPECTKEREARTVAATAPLVSAAAVQSNGTTVVAIDLRTDSSIADTRVVKSSGDPALDQSALNAVKLSKFETGTFLCHPIPSTYLYIVVFGSGTPLHE